MTKKNPMVVGLPPETKWRRTRLIISAMHVFIGEWDASVWLDRQFIASFVGGTEPEARAAAQAYVDELIKHFQDGGR